MHATLPLLVRTDFPPLRRRAIDTLQAHLAPNTTSDFAFKGVLRDKATAVWRGMIKVAKDAQRTNASTQAAGALSSVAPPPAFAAERPTTHTW